MLEPKIHNSDLERGIKTLIYTGIFSIYAINLFVRIKYCPLIVGLLLLGVFVWEFWVANRDSKELELLIPNKNGKAGHILRSMIFLFISVAMFFVIIFILTSFFNMPPVDLLSMYLFVIYVLCRNIFFSQYIYNIKFLKKGVKSKGIIATTINWNNVDCYLLDDQEPSLILFLKDDDSITYKIDMEFFRNNYLILDNYLNNRINFKSLRFKS